MQPQDQNPLVPPQEPENEQDSFLRASQATEQPNSIPNFTQQPATPAQHTGMPKILIIIGGSVLLLAIAALSFMIINGQQNFGSKQAMSAQDAQTSNRQSPETVNAKNLKRKNDVLKLSVAVAIFEANNNGKLPTKLTEGKLTGLDTPSYPEALDLDIYSHEHVDFKQGKQAPLDDDLLVIVTRADCIEDGGTLLANSRSAAIQYMIETVDDGLAAQCYDM